MFIFRAPSVRKNPVHSFSRSGPVEQCQRRRGMSNRGRYVADPGLEDKGAHLLSGADREGGAVAIQLPYIHRSRLAGTRQWLGMKGAVILQIPAFSLPADRSAYIAAHGRTESQDGQHQEGHYSFSPDDMRNGRLEGGFLLGSGQHSTSGLRNAARLSLKQPGCRRHALWFILSFFISEGHVNFRTGHVKRNGHNRPMPWREGRLGRGDELPRWYIRKTS